MSLPVGLGIDAGNRLDGFLEIGEMRLETWIGLGPEDGTVAHHRRNCRFGQSKYNHTGLLTIQSQLIE